MLWDDGMGSRRNVSSLLGSLEFSLFARSHDDATHPSPLRHFAQRLTDDYDRYIVLSFTNATMVLEVRVVGVDTGYSHTCLKTTRA